MEGEAISQNPIPEIKQTPDIGAFYKTLVKQEFVVADPNELIFIGPIKRDDHEYQKLVETGVPEQAISERRITRRDLLNAGFAFNNQPLLAIEKPLINAVINGVNYGERKLLTREELEIVKQYQRQYPELYGSEETASDEFRKDLLSFILTSQDVLPDYIKNRVNFLRLCINNITTPYFSFEAKSQYDKDKLTRKVNPIYKKLIDIYRSAVISKDNFYQDEVRIIENDLADVMPWEEQEGFNRFNITARGKRAMLIESRRIRLNGLPSPFFDSGFHFPSNIGNPDYTVIGSNGKLFRVNMLVFHLTSRGVSEMGDDTQKDGEQDYSIGNYIRDLAPRDETERSTTRQKEEAKLQLILSFNQEELMKKVQGRLKQMALTWAASQIEDSQAKKLAEEIKMIESRKVEPALKRLFKTITKRV